MYRFKRTGLQAHYILTPSSSTRYVINALIAERSNALRMQILYRTVDESISSQRDRLRTTICYHDGDRLRDVRRRSLTATSVRETTLAENVDTNPRCESQYVSRSDAARTMQISDRSVHLSLCIHARAGAELRLFSRRARRSQLV